MMINNVIILLRIRIILLLSFMICFFFICHSGSFPIVHTYNEQAQVSSNFSAVHNNSVPHIQTAAAALDSQVDHYRNKNSLLKQQATHEKLHYAVENSLQ